jgi:hypothetical protein
MLKGVQRLHRLDGRQRRHRVAQSFPEPLRGGTGSTSRKLNSMRVRIEGMIVAVVGSRTFADYEAMKRTLSELDVSGIVSGGARGADKLAERYADEEKIPITVLKPDWSKGRGAGKERNSDIVVAAQTVVAFWDGKSPGTKDTIAKARAANKEVVVVLF